MPEHDVATLLRSTVEPPSVEVDVDGLRTRARRRRTRRHLAVGAGTGLVVVALALGTLAVADERGDEQVTVGTTRPDASATTSAPAAAPVYAVGASYVLEGVPAGFSVVAGDRYVEDGPPGSTITLQSEEHGFVRVFSSFAADGLQGSFDRLLAEAGTVEVEVEVVTSASPTPDGDREPEPQPLVAALHVVAGETPSLAVLVSDTDLVLIDMGATGDPSAVHDVAQSILDHLRPAPDARPTGQDAPGGGEDAITAVMGVFSRWLHAGGDVEQTVAAVQDGEDLRATIEAAITSAPFDPALVRGSTVSVGATDDHGVQAVTYEILGPDGEVVHRGEGTAVQVGAEWLVSRETYCAAIAVGSVRCPEDESLVQGD
jgi:hypothetical protein